MHHCIEVVINTLVESIHESAYRALLIDEQDLTEKPNCFRMTVSLGISTLTCLRKNATQTKQKYKD